MRKKTARKLIAFIASLIVLFTLLPLTSFADNQTTIICFTPQKSKYEVGDTLEVDIGVSSPDGGYLTKAYCGFGYNEATMELVSDVDGESRDHIWAGGGSPTKWVWAKLTFKIKAEGKLYFIAGAYSGNGMIQGYKADGSRIACPRASVVYPIGTGIFTPTSDCNLKSCRIYNAETGEQIEFNRSFDKYSTNYFAHADTELKEIRIEAEAELAEDKVLLPEDLKIHGGVNEIKVGVQAVGGGVKEYVFVIQRPEEAASVSDIRLTTGDGTVIPYDFDPEVYNYDIKVGNGVELINYEAVTNGNSKAVYPVLKTIDPGYNIKYVDIETSTDSKRYEYYIYRELSALCLSSLVVEGNDGETKEITPEFDPLVTDYKINVTSDIRSVKVAYTLGNEEDFVKEENLDDVKLEPGYNLIQVTVTDGANENVYCITVVRDETQAATLPEETESGPIVNNTEHTAYKTKDLSKWAIAGIGALVLLLIVILFLVLKASSEYKNSEEAIGKREEKERQVRLKKEAKEREKAQKKAEKK